MKYWIYISLFYTMFVFSLYPQESQCTKGDCQDGYGELTFFEGSKPIAYYKGNFVSGKYEGKGTLKQKDILYTGNWREGKQHGLGKAKFPNGEQFYGYYNNGTIEGKGKFKDKDGNLYVGSFKDGMYHGSGTMYYHDGKVYIGSWKGDKRHGKGKLFQKLLFSGDWLDDNPRK